MAVTAGGTVGDASVGWGTAPGQGRGLASTAQLCPRGPASRAAVATPLQLRTCSKMHGRGVSRPTQLVRLIQLISTEDVIPGNQTVGQDLVGQSNVAAENSATDLNWSTLCAPPTIRRKRFSFCSGDCSRRARPQDFCRALVISLGQNFKKFTSNLSQDANCAKSIWGGAPDGAKPSCGYPPKRKNSLSSFTFLSFFLSFFLYPCLSFSLSFFLSFFLSSTMRFKGLRTLRCIEHCFLLLQRGLCEPFLFPPPLTQNASASSTAAAAASGLFIYVAPQNGAMFVSRSARLPAPQRA